MKLALTFPTPIAMHERPGLAGMNRAITEILVAESTTVPSLTHSNVGGWHSGRDLQHRHEPCFRQLSELFVSCVRETTEDLAQRFGSKLPKFSVRTDIWAMVMRDGHYTIPHTHADSHWACVYYADDGEPDLAQHPSSGVITFVDPRSSQMPIPGLDVLSIGHFEVQVKTGQLLVFPGALLHFVHAFRGPRPRVSLACNVTLEV